MTRRTGEIRMIKLEGGYGFLRTSDTREDMYFHCSELLNAKIDDLKIRDAVSFLVRKSRKGRYAIDVILEGVQDQEQSKGGEVL